MSTPWTPRTVVTTSGYEQDVIDLPDGSRLVTHLHRAVGWLCGDCDRRQKPTTPRLYRPPLSSTSPAICPNCAENPLKQRQP